MRAAAAAVSAGRVLRGGAAHRALGDAMVTARVLLKMLALSPAPEAPHGGT
ncbi:MAG: hypothetical protein LBF64_01175 [Oscillospiraceae bacterium]|nr:hypothetical protein [Oscillospiraceae bacterium]